MRAVKYLVFTLLAGYCLALVLYAGNANMDISHFAKAEAANSKSVAEAVPVSVVPLSAPQGLFVASLETSTLEGDVAAPEKEEPKVAALEPSFTLETMDQDVVSDVAPDMVAQDISRHLVQTLPQTLPHGSADSQPAFSAEASVGQVALEDTPKDTTAVTETVVTPIAAPQLDMPAPVREGGVVDSPEPAPLQKTEEPKPVAQSVAEQVDVSLPVLGSVAEAPAVMVALQQTPEVVVPELAAAGLVLDAAPAVLGISMKNTPVTASSDPALPTLLLAAAGSLNGANASLLASTAVSDASAYSNTPGHNGPSYSGIALPLPTAGEGIVSPAVSPAAEATKAPAPAPAVPVQIVPALNVPALDIPALSGLHDGRSASDKGGAKAGQQATVPASTTAVSPASTPAASEPAPRGASGGGAVNLPFPFVATKDTPAMPTSATISTESTKGDILLRRLSNGLTVLVKKDERFPLVSLRLYVHAGSSYETPEQAGISHVLEHMVFKGTDAFPKGSIATSVESSGGYLNAATSFDYTVYITDMTKANWESGLGILKEMAFSPTLDPAELESEKEVIVAELKRSKDTPSGRLFDAVLAGVMAHTPYERPIIGYEETIRSFTAQGIRDYIRQWYQPRSMLLVISGNVDLDTAFARAEATFGHLQNDPAIVEPLRPAAVPSDRTNFAIETGPWQKTHLIMAFPAPALADVRSAHLDVLSHLMGGDTTSHLFRTYQYEKRLVDSISMSNYSFEGSGLVFVEATLDAEKLVPFWTAFTKDMAGIGLRTFTQAEFDRAKLNIEDSLYRSKETLAGLTSKLGFFQFLYGSLDAENNYLQSVQTTGPETLLALAPGIFRPETATVAALLPEAVPLEAFGLPKGATSVAGWLKEELERNWPSTARADMAQGTASSAAAREVIDLGNGCTVILQPDTTLPYISATLMYTGGDSLLDRANEGLGSFTASLLTKGTGGSAGKKSGRTTNEIREFLADRAAGLSAASSRQTFTVSFDCPTRFADDLFTLMGEVLRNPALLEEEAQRVRQNQIAAIVQSEDSALSLTFRRMFPHFFSKHPYGLMQLGTKENVEGFTPDMARQFWKKQVAQPWTLSLCGDLDRETLERGLKAIPMATGKAISLPKPQWSDNRELGLRLAGRNQAHLMLVFPTAALGSEDEAGLTLLQTVLDGQSGLLFRDLRDRQGLGYTVSAFNWKAQRTGAMVFYIGTQPETLEQARSGFDTIIKTLHTELLPEAELERGKNLLEGSYYRKRQSLGARSAEAATLHVLGLPLDAEQQMIARASSLAPKDLQALARKYLDPDKAYTITVLP